MTARAIQCPYWCDRNGCPTDAPDGVLLHRRDLGGIVRRDGRRLTAEVCQLTDDRGADAALLWLGDEEITGAELAELWPQLEIARRLLQPD
ncbi:hypothetical protein GCM10010123_15620 [Pilimelia anulata]|uniref:Uncharacterized protein n=1 Tax=Pilimelia anulata TaxID=53371 RepID=A0A8J3F8G9_9ACTN|nr:hypothetical protein [Pilimelia anulata]GGJ86925.1 hypothetical protein GCM10010123_15620 [Pilimelia anulata]